MLRPGRKRLWNRNQERLARKEERYRLASGRGEKVPCPVRGCSRTVRPEGLHDHVHGVHGREACPLFHGACRPPTTIPISARDLGGRHD